MNEFSLFLNKSVGSFAVLFHKTTSPHEMEPSLVSNIIEVMMQHPLIIVLRMEKRVKVREVKNFRAPSTRLTTSQERFKSEPEKYARYLQIFQNGAPTANLPISIQHKLAFKEEFTTEEKAID